MIERSEQMELSEQAVAQKVAEYLNDRHPGGINLEVDPDGVQRGEFGWRVRVRPSEEPHKLIEYYEALVDVEMDLAEREQLNVWLVTGDPKHPQRAHEQPPMAEDKALSSHSPGRLKRRLKGTKQWVARKVAEYLRDCQIEGITLEVEADRIRKNDYWWEVPVRPDVEPRQRTEYYEALIATQDALETREQLAVFLVPGEPRQPEAAENG